jgi:hypothetical protein
MEGSQSSMLRAGEGINILKDDGILEVKTTMENNI